MGICLIPHTIEWFLRLEVTDPRIFEFIERTIVREDQSHLCGFCGSAPASDFEIIEPRPQKGHVATFSLCSDCADMARRSGKVLEPWPRAKNQVNTDVPQ